MINHGESQNMRAKLLELQDTLIAKLGRIDGGTFECDHWQRPTENPKTFTGDGRSCILENSNVIERGGGQARARNLREQHRAAFDHI